MATTKSARRAPWHDQTWPLWLLSLVLVLVLHASAFLLLRQMVPSVGAAAPEAIMIDFAPEPSALEPASPAPPPRETASPALTPPEPAPLEPPPPIPPPDVPPPPEPSPPLEPDLKPAPPLIQDIAPEVAPVVPKAKVAVLPQRPPVHRSRPVPVQPKTAPLQPEAPPSQPAPPGPAAIVPSGQAPAAWEGQLLAHLARYKRFPPMAQRRGEQGTVLMRLTIAHDGAVLSMSMARGSGYADLDQEAVAWLTRAQPLPAFSPDVTAQQMQLVVPLRFILQ